MMRGIRRHTRRLYERACACYLAGIHFESGYKVAAPDGGDPCRIAFDAGRQAQLDGHPGAAMSLDVWMQVLAQWFAQEGR